jgi:hypothetical protein
MTKLESEAGLKVRVLPLLEDGSVLLASTVGRYQGAVRTILPSRMEKFPLIPVTDSELRELGIGIGCGACYKRK